MDARSYRKKEFAKVLEQHDKEKKDKYLQNCLEMRYQLESLFQHHRKLQ
jgi:hypothetical protein